MPERIEDLHIEQELQDSYLTYAMSTIMGPGAARRP
jgi:DNA gyrase/topoisomerase IV subunit A